MNYKLSMVEETENHMWNRILRSVIWQRLTLANSESYSLTKKFLASSTSYIT